MITIEEFKANAIERFWKKLNFYAPNGCWEWQKGKSKKGYGSFSIRQNGKAKNVQAHRYIYQVIFGDFDSKLQVHHYVCDNPPCCNPAHLKLGTNQDNMDDMLRKGRHRTDPRRGSKSGQAKLTEDQVLIIKERLSKGDFLKEIAADYNVSDNLIWCIKANKTWKHVVSDAVPFRRRGNWKLTEDQVRLIKLRLSVGESSSSVGTSFNLDYKHMHRIKTGRIWKHVQI